MRTPIKGLGCAALILASTALAEPAASVAGSATTQPAVVADAPTTAPVVAIAPEVEAQLHQISAAYAALKTLSVAGSIRLDAQINGKTLNKQAEFTALFIAPVQFRHEIKGELIASNGADKSYVFLPAENIYMANDAAKAKARIDDMPGSIPTVLRSEDLSLGLAMSSDVEKDLTTNAASVTQAIPLKIQDKSYPALLIATPNADLTVAFDPTTHLLREVKYDEGRPFRERGADVESAVTTVDYVTSTPDGDVQPSTIAFTPPATAQQQQPQGADGDATAMVGKPVPAFKTSLLDGSNISNESLKDSVYVLDFWATWCGPCKQSLPGLDEIYKANKDAGLKVFAVNQGEDEATAKKFQDDTKLSIPIAMDKDQKVGNTFGANAIPETVVVGKDGTVLKVFVGSGNEDGIKSAVAAALKGEKPQ